MRVTKVTKLKKKYIQYDISTTSANFYVQAGGKWVLVHNSPAIFAGIDPSDGKFFVAKKGIFNKNPRVYKLPNDIDNDIDNHNLANKLKLALKYLPKLGITGVIQGDFLFGPGDLKNETINGEKLITFHPNTIAYAIPANSAASAAILQAKIGVVWHTTYHGSSFETMKASYGVDVSSLHKVKEVWSQDAMLRDLSSATMSAEETKEVNELLSYAGKLFNQISGTTLRELESNKEIQSYIDIYNNEKVKQGVVITNTVAHTNGLISWIKNRYNKEISKLKTERGRSGKQAKLDEVMAFFSNENKNSLVKIFELQKTIVLAKLKLINSLNKLNSIKTFVKTRHGFKVTGAEGFVAIDKLGGDAVKIVDRMEFSYNNFSPDILKGWDKPGRN